MDPQFDNTYHKSRRNEYRLSNSTQNIKMSFPSLKDLTLSRLTRKCMKIDHCQIEYRPLTPHNAQGLVDIEIHDMRLNVDQSRQAWYRLPIHGHYQLNFFSDSYFSMNDAIPWKATIRTSRTNMNTDTPFCTIKARLKLSSEKHSEFITWRSPSVKIIAGHVSHDQIDFGHVDRAPPLLLMPEQEAITMEANDINKGTYLPLTIGMGESYQQSLRSTSSRHSIGEVPSSKTAEDPQPPSTHRRTESADDSMIHMTPNLLANLVKTASTASVSNKAL